MLLRWLCSIFLIFYATALLFGKDWKDTPVSAWTLSDLREILAHSAWVCQSSTTFPGIDFRPKEIPTPIFHPPAHGDVLRSSCRYPVIRILTAWPIRNALLALSIRNSAIVNIDSLGSEGLQDSEAARRDRLQRFVETYPMDVRVAGNSDFIIFSLTMKLVNQTDSGIDAHEYAYPIPELEDVSLSELLPATCLSTRSGKRISPSRYESPQKDQLGAKLYFPRRLPDGRASIIPSDEELQLDISLRGRRIKASFKLKKMLYNGRLEI